MKMRLIAILLVLVCLVGCGSDDNPIGPRETEMDRINRETTGEAPGGTAMAMEAPPPSIPDESGLIPATGAAGSSGPSNVTIRIVGVTPSPSMNEDPSP